MKIKPLLIFLTIFITGFGCGFLVSGRLTKKSIEAAKERETPVGFKKDLYKYLNPDESQKQIIDSIVADYIPKIKEEREISRIYQKHLRDSMFAEIQQLLSNKQKDNLQKFEKEKIIKKSEPKIARLKDTSKIALQKSHQKRIEDFKKSLTDEQKNALDSIFNKKTMEPPNPEMNKELRQYTRINIVPVMMKYRLEFENELSDDEKAIIADLRQKRQTLIKTEMLGIEDDKSIEKQKAMIAEAKILLKDIIAKHKLSLEKIALTLKPEREKWEADMDAIKARYIANYKPGDSPNFRNKDKIAIDFILMNGERKIRKGRNRE